MWEEENKNGRIQRVGSWLGCALRTCYISLILCILENNYV
jgi:hypothetical protein